MKLVVFHYHFRPGGVRRVIELALPHLVRLMEPRIDTIVLAGGESPDFHWLNYLTETLPRMSVELPTHPALGYFSESGLSPQECLRQARQTVAGILEGANAANCIVWAHNLGLARNPLLAKALAEVTARRRIPLIAHHHDWWFDNRWQRWPELRAAGIRTLHSTASLIFPTRPNIHHVTINQADLAPLQPHFHNRASWLPNLMDRMPPVPPERIEKARAWLEERTQKKAPVWLFPCRLLRRKNIAEALLLTRWLRPEAWLITTGAPSSPGEEPYAQALTETARHNGWKARLGVLQGEKPGNPTVPDLLAASETVILTAIQEGFGLPFLEAAAASRPLIARAIPNVFPDLAQFGFHFPQQYSELLIHPALFNEKAERQRQQNRYRRWHNALPHACRGLAGAPALITAHRSPQSSSQPIPFSRLTLAAQLEVLTQPPEHSWQLCAPLNPFLEPWRNAAAKSQLQAPPWPEQAAQWLGGEAYARHFQQIAQTRAQNDIAPDASLATQAEFLRQRLATPNLFPLLWTSEP